MENMAATPEETLINRLHPCEHQTAFGNEPPCCQLKWLLVLNDQAYVKKVLENQKVPTACIPGTMGRYCFEGQEARIPTSESPKQFYIC